MIILIPSFLDNENDNTNSSSNMLYNADSGVIRIVAQPTYTYKAPPEGERVIGYTDGLDAMEQAVFKVLSTERYKHAIYNHDYGIELEDLFGMPASYVKSELQRRISECLLTDERIKSVENYGFPAPDRNEYNDERTTIVITFTVKTVFGNLSINKKFELSAAKS